ncbi:hypothetical protein TWF481_006584 [Arthrobotrys musiformis]|uniref:F-box domain-containing protein n=1 Tax=Arthrobotrys musiformis TaxID=47236 RepID=A0AAV9W8Y7_9PEZI
MPTLESLPIDIKFAILSFLPTARSLRSLCHAYESYLSVYQTYHTLIDSTVLYNDALEHYSRDSLWLARYHDALGNTKNDNCQERRSSCVARAEYLAFPNALTVEDAERISYSEELRKEVYSLIEGTKKYGSPIIFSQQKEGKNRIVQNHRVVLEISRRLVHSKLSKQQCWKGYSTNEQNSLMVADELPYSCFAINCEEEERIIKAIYRFFVGVNVTYISSEDYQVSFRDGLDTWGCRGIVVVKVVRDFFLEVFARMESSLPYQQNWTANRKLYPSWYERPVFPSRMVLLHEFPGDILPWVDGEYFKDTDRFHKRLEEIHASASRSRGYSLRFDVWGDDSLFFADQPVNPIPKDQDDLRYQQRWSCRGRIYKRHSLPHRRSFTKSGDQGHIDNNVQISHYQQFRNSQISCGHTPPFDPEAAIWDFERLGELGYCLCGWRLSRSERYQPLYQEEEPEDLWHNLGSGCLMICEPYERDVHADELSLYTDSDDWGVYGQIERYKTNLKWRKGEKRRQNGLFPSRGYRSRLGSRRKGGGRFTPELKFDHNLEEANEQDLDCVESTDIFKFSAQN